MTLFYSCGDITNPDIDPVPGSSFGSVIKGTVQNGSSVSTSGENLFSTSAEEAVSGARIKLIDSNLIVYSDTEGRFTIHGVPPGIYNLLVESDYGLAGYIEDIHVPKDGIVDTGHIYIKKTSRIEGWVTLGGSTVSAKGVTVSVKDTRHFSLTEESGYYQIENVPAGDWTITALVRPYCQSVLQNVSIQAGVSAFLPDINLNVCQAVQGKIMGHAYATNNKDHSGIKVSDINSGDYTLSDSDGLWVLDGLSIGPYNLAFEKHGYDTLLFQNVAAVDSTNTNLITAYLKPSSWQDIDGDGQNNEFDDDDDNDGFDDFHDSFPSLLAECTDLDQDGIGNNTDNDADNDNYFYKSDCDDLNRNVWDSCQSCMDEDLDGYFAGCDSYIGIKKNCLDSHPWLWDSCSISEDKDGDDYFTIHDADPALAPVDCNDSIRYKYPGAPEYCDGFDNHCFGDAGHFLVDEGCSLKILGKFERRINNAEVLDEKIYFIDDFSFNIYDISNPSDPQFLGQIPLMNSYFLDVEENSAGQLMAYAESKAPSNGKLTALNVTNPANIQITGSTDSNYGNDILAKGDFVYIATHSGYDIFDFSDPSNPSGPNSKIMYPGQKYKFGGKYQDKLYLFNYDKTGIIISDLVNSSSDELICFNDLISYVKSFKITGDRLFFSGTSNIPYGKSYGFVIGDLLSDAGDGCPPHFKDKHSDITYMTVNQEGGNLADIYVQGDYLYFISGYELSLFNVGYSNDRFLVKKLDVFPYLVSNIFVKENIAFLSVNNNTILYMIDITEYNK
jgi:Putative metal-binding motif/LVIVD repeat